MDVIDVIFPTLNLSSSDEANDLSILDRGITHYLSTVLSNVDYAFIDDVDQVYFRNVRIFADSFSCKVPSYVYSITGVSTWIFDLNYLRGINKK